MTAESPRWLVELGIPGFVKVSREWSEASPREQINSLDDEKLQALIARMRQRRKFAQRTQNASLEATCCEFIEAAEEILRDRQDRDLRREPKARRVFSE